MKFLHLNTFTQLNSFRNKAMKVLDIELNINEYSEKLEKEML